MSLAHGNPRDGPAFARAPSELLSAQTEDFPDLI
jgi:hypothetical protein